MDLLRLCFVEDAAKYLHSEDDVKTVARWEELIKDEIEKQLTWVHGYDRQSRAIIHRGSRSTSEVNEEGYNLAILYFTEKAIACTEVESRGRKHKILVMLDFGNYHSNAVPPMALVQESVKTLQVIYPERTKKVFVLESPFWVKLAYLVISPFLSKETKDKVPYADSFLSETADCDDRH